MVRSGGTFWAVQVTLRKPANQTTLSLLFACVRADCPFTRRSGFGLTLFAERGGRGTGERQTVPPKAERMVLLEVALEMLEVALN